MCLICIFRDTINQGNAKSNLDLHVFRYTSSFLYQCFIFAMLKQLFFQKVRLYTKFKLSTVFTGDPNLVQIGD